MAAPYPASILVVDDDESVLTVVEVCLRAAGYAVASASGRDSVLRMLATKHFDLVITDVLMPEFDGTEVVMAAKTHQPAVTIIAMSGGGPYFTAEFCLKMAKALGAGGPLIKPFHLDEL